MLQMTHRIQRMKRPKSYNLVEGVKPHHVFGGPMGLSTEGWKILDQICTLDYMGAAEYEAWGGGPGPTPLALSRMVEWAGDGKLCSFSFVIGPHERELNWDRKFAKKDQLLPPAKFVVIYGIVHESARDAVQERIRVLAKSEKSFYVKGGTHLPNSLDPLNRHDINDPVCGWLELDNTFIFFSDRTMWEGYCDIFGIEKCAAPEPPTMVDYTKMRKPELVDSAMSLGMFAFKADAKRVKTNELKQILIEAQEKAHASSVS